MPTGGITDFTGGWSPASLDNRHILANDFVCFKNVRVRRPNQVVPVGGTEEIHDLTDRPDIPNICYSARFGDSLKRYVGTSEGGILGDDGNSMLEPVYPGDNPILYNKHIIRLIEGRTVFSRFKDHLIIGNSSNNFYSPDGIGLRRLGCQPAPEKVSFGLSPGAQTLTELGGNRSDWQLASGRFLSVLDAGSSVRCRTDENAYCAIRIRNPIDASGDPNDEFDAAIKLGDPLKLVNIRIAFSLTEIDSLPNPVFTDYYYADISTTHEDINLTNLSWSGITFRRSEFVRYGTADLDWSDVKEAWIFAKFTSESFIELGNALKFVGGKGSLSGEYAYLMVLVNELGQYTAKSVPSESHTIKLRRQRCFIEVPAPVEHFFTHVWVYRKKLNNDWSGQDVLGNSYTRVAIREAGGIFEDIIDDIIATEMPLANLFLDNVPEGITDIAGPYFGRMIYMTADKIYPSDYNDPGVVDTRAIIDVSGRSSETNLWITKVREATLLIGTTEDIYALSGTGAIINGQIDFTLTPLGVGQPPVSAANAVYEDSLIYFASDGWRLLSGTTSQNLSYALRELFYESNANQLHRASCGSDAIYTDATGCTSIAVSDNALWASVLDRRNERHLFIYDLVHRCWSNASIPATYVFAEEDGRLIVTVGGSNSGLHRANSPTTYDQFGEGARIDIRTKVLPNAHPSQRKDVENISLLGSGGGNDTSLGLRQSPVSARWPTFGFGDLFNIPIEVNNIPPEVNPVLDFIIRGVTGLSLEAILFEYTPRPIPRNRLLLQQSNLGVAALKRIDNMPLEIDTLGSEIIATPIVDGQDLPTSIIRTTQKETAFVDFPLDSYGIDFGVLLTAGQGAFEFYQLGQPAITDVLSQLMKKDRIGPLIAKEVMWFREASVYIYATGNILYWSLDVDDQTRVDYGTISTEAGKLMRYDIKIVKAIKGCVGYLNLESPTRFSLQEAECRVGTSGRSTNLQILRSRRNAR